MSDYIGNELELFQYAHNWKRYFSSNLHQYIAGQVLEVGAGLGINARFLKTPSTNSWTFMEPDPLMAKQIKGNNSDLEIPFDIIEGTIHQIGSRKFDTIIYIDVLEHIKDSIDELRKLEKLLHPSGHVLILVPAYHFLFNNFDQSIGHYRRYNKTQLRKEIDSVFLEKKLFYLDSIGFFASVYNKMIANQDKINPTQIKLWDQLLVPISKITDKIVFHQFGKSLIGVFQKI